MGDFSFEAHTLSAGSYANNPGDTNWLFSATSGVSANGSALTSGVAVAPDGSQVGFLQGATSVISQVLTFPVDGQYYLVVSTAAHAGTSGSLETVKVFVDGALVGQVVPTTAAYQTAMLSFKVNAGSHTFSFQGAAANDATALIDDVVLIGP